MGKIKRYKNAVERFLSGESGQRFFNFAYSIGAAIVIWGALFKILHLPGGNMLLSIGMGTEVLMFILTAFDRPPREYHWEEVFPVLSSHDADDRPDFVGGNVVVGGGAVTAPAALIETDPSPDMQVAAAPLSAGTSAILGQPYQGDPADMLAVQKHYVEQIDAMAIQMQQFGETTRALNEVSQTLLDSYRAITDNSTSINESSTGYVEQMQALNRNITGLNTIYEIQLKSVSSQLDAIDRVNRGIKDISAMYENSASQSTRYCEETEKMTHYMQQLNQVYAQMLRAMTVNMAAAGATPSAPVADADNLRSAES